MENQHYNLAENEFSKESKIILWSFSGLFFLTGVFIVFRSLILKNVDLNAGLSLVPFGISFVVGIIAAFATTKRENLFFSVTEEKIEYRFGIINPKTITINWSDIKELTVPSKQKKIMVTYNNGDFYIVNLTWLEKKRAVHIIKHIYHNAREKNIHTTKVKYLVEKRLLEKK